MMTKLYARPYDISATGFYFDSAMEYDQKAAVLRNAYSQPVEEFEIQFIDGDGIDAQLFEALSVSQADIAAFFEAAENWGETDKVKVALAVGEAGHRFRLGADDPKRLEVDLYQVDSLRDLAMQFVDEGLFGEIPAAIANYLDYDAIGYDLGMDYATAEIDGTRYAYRCG